MNKDIDTAVSNERVYIDSKTTKMPPITGQEHNTAANDYSASENTSNNVEKNHNKKVIKIIVQIALAVAALVILMLNESDSPFKVSNLQVNNGTFSFMLDSKKDIDTIMFTVSGDTADGTILFDGKDRKRYEDHNVNSNTNIHSHLNELNGATNVKVTVTYIKYTDGSTWKPRMTNFYHIVKWSK